MKNGLFALLMLAGVSVCHAAPYLAHAPLSYQGAVTAVVPWGATIQCLQAGTEIGSITYTPTWASNKLIISAQVQGQTSAFGTLQLSLCQDGVTNTLGRFVKSVAATPVAFAEPLGPHWIVNAGTTQPRTYRIMLGSDSGINYTVYSNAFPGFISVQEIQVLP